MCIGMANGGKIMTPQEAITTLKREYLGDSEFMELAKQMGVNALEKQIPKKVKVEQFNIYNLYYCPTCDGCIGDNLGHIGYGFCSGCGQRLDWSDTE